MKTIVLFLFIAFPFAVLAQQFTVYNTANSEIPDNLIKTVTTDSDGKVWFVTGDCFSGGNVVCFDKKTFTIYDTAQGIPDRFVTCIAFDTNGVMWLGSRYHGLSSYDGKIWKNYNASNSLFPDNHVRSVTIDKHNRIWAGTDKGLAVFFNDKWDVMNTSNSALPDNIINSVACEMKSNAIWIATDKGLLWAYAYGAIREMINPAPLIYTKKNSLLPDDMVNQIVIDDSNNVWISGWGGIVKYSKGKWKLYSPENSKLPAFVEYFLTTHNNEIWIASNMGLCILKNDEWKIFTPSNSSMPDFFVNRIAFDNAGDAWIATQSGLVKFSEK